MTGSLRTLLGFGIIALIVGSAPVALGDGAANILQIYGLALDETRLGNGFCEDPELGEAVRRDCGNTKQKLPRIAGIEVQTTPAPYVRLGLAPDSAGRDGALRIWYAPREEGGQSFMISTMMHVDSDLAGARGNVLERFGPPTVEFTHADMEARGIAVADLTIDTLLYVDRALPDTEWTRIAHRLRSAFNPTGPELFSLTNTKLRTLSRLLGADFRGAIVQISESGWSHDSTVTTILLDLKRAQSIFQLEG